MGFGCGSGLDAESWEAELGRWTARARSEGKLPLAPAGGRSFHGALMRAATEDPTALRIDLADGSPAPEAQLAAVLARSRLSGTLAIVENVDGGSLPAQEALDALTLHCAAGGLAAATYAGSLDGLNLERILWHPGPRLARSPNQENRRKVERAKRQAETRGREVAQ